METEYSADDIASAKSLQTFTVRLFPVEMRSVDDDRCMCYQYIYSAYCLDHIFLILTQFSIDGCVLGGPPVAMYFCRLLNWLIQTYDYVCSIHEEVMYLSALFRSRWTKVKGLYIVTRYTPFLLFASYLYMNFSSNENFNHCQTINTICACFSVISLVCAESFFIIRTYVLWNKSRIVLAVVLTTSLVSPMRSPYHKLLATAPFETSVIPGITGCYQSSGGFDLFIPFLLLFVLEL
ncbi:hypothetical protein AZE42_11611 [Rhizopogon vesiculosus]|uniref:DUF6533 domain-containing protein n=1 Tax=Rhizopogon vesiculosus TaxID=180088 RepID=A0A1J8PLV3_9AGAM|nr:hypothetical protein AZE42_11611 [Rhizopogon vesiculosus]